MSSETSKKGVPYVSILTSCAWGFLTVFAYMTSVGGSAAYIACAGIIFTRLPVRSRLLSHSITPNAYPFKAYGSIWIYRFNLFLNSFLLLIQGFTAFKKPFNWSLFIVSHITIPTTSALFVGYKLLRVNEMDFSDRLLKLEDEEEKKVGFIGRLFNP